MKETSKMRKKILFTLVAAALVFALLPAGALAEGETYNAHDVGKLRAYLDYASNGINLSSSYDSSDPSTWPGVTWVEGSDGELHLKTVDFSSSIQSGSLDLSGCTSLETIECYNNLLLTGLTTAGCTSLESVLCYHTSIESIDVSGITALAVLNAGDCELTSSGLNIAGCVNLKELYVSINQLTTLDVTAFTKLEKFHCHTNDLTGLDISALTDLTELSCYNNDLTALNVTGLSEIEHLECQNNRLTSLDVSMFADLQYLNCSGNAITSLNLDGNDNLQTLYCSNNALTSLDLRNMNTNSLSLFNATGNQLTELWISTIHLAASQGGYVSITINPAATYYFAEPKSGAAFINWTDADGAVISTNPEYQGDESVLTARFLCLTPSISSGQINTGGSIVLTPNVDGGEWEWDEEYLSAKFNSPATFKALKAGTTTVTYTVDGVSAAYNILIQDTALFLTSNIASGKIKVGGCIELTPTKTGGDWTWDKDFLSATFGIPTASFTGLKEGTTTVTYTLNGVTTTYDITIESLGLPPTGQNGTWLWMLMASLAVACGSGAALIKKRSAKA